MESEPVYFEDEYDFYQQLGANPAQEEEFNERESSDSFKSDSSNDEKASQASSVEVRRLITEEYPEDNQQEGVPLEEERHAGMKSALNRSGILAPQELRKRSILYDDKRAGSMSREHTMASAKPSGIRPPSQTRVYKKLSDSRPEESKKERPVLSRTLTKGLESSLKKKIAPVTQPRQSTSQTRKPSILSSTTPRRQSNLVTLRQPTLGAKNELHPGLANFSMTAKKAPVVLPSPKGGSMGSPLMRRKTAFVTPASPANFQLKLSIPNEPSNMRLSNELTPKETQVPSFPAFST